MEGAYKLLENSRMDNMEYDIPTSMAAEAFFGKALGKPAEHPSGFGLVY
jgi:hypothetical protein